MNNNKLDKQKQAAIEFVLMLGASKEEAVRVANMTSEQCDQQIEEALNDLRNKLLQASDSDFNDFGNQAISELIRAESVIEKLHACELAKMFFTTIPLRIELKRKQTKH
ncbi:hypothetical protein KPA96_13745 [Burkholderia cenocepacia]|uniref:hypothetical protein n=1 Tax=Burkholderia cenocepacia TaxID=95486 RepID=UPI002854F483|nr:hypothetical protein [Burkholderia cenocepacia]MDR8076720.1 hypothetical protein [Burkholderia cenocepacia]